MASLCMGVHMRGVCVYNRTCSTVGGWEPGKEGVGGGGGENSLNSSDFTLLSPRMGSNILISGLDSWFSR